MSSGPPPHGQVIGLFKVLHKSTPHAGSVSITAAGDNGTIIFRLDEEPAEYFVVGDSYQILATTP